METPTSLAEVQAAVQSLSKVRVVGGGTKPSLSAGATLSSAKLSGILEYNPSEYTFTALAGTPLREIRDELARNGQAMPFDPPLVEAGGTLGGTVAAGLSGPGRFRYGGVRDFFLGTRLVTGEGRVVFGGGKVVKNAAGFDIPKLVAGGLGVMGVLVELSFKVFPQPAAFATVRAELPDFASATAAMTRVAMSQAEVTCLDLEAPNGLLVRIGGLEAAIDSRVNRVRGLIGDVPTTVLRGDAEHQLWSDVREFRWVGANSSLIKLPIAPGQMRPLDEVLQRLDPLMARRYSVGGNVAWIAWPQTVPSTELLSLCRQLNRNALALTGQWAPALMGDARGGVFRERLLSQFDPTGKLVLPS